MDLLSGKIRVRFQTASGKSKIAETQKAAENNSPRVQLEMDCYSELLTLAKDIGRRYNTNYSNIFPEFLLRDLAKQLPVTLDEILNSVSGVTAYKLDRYKQEFIQFLDITMKYTAILATLDIEDENVAFQEDTFTTDVEGESSYFLQHEPSSSFRGRRGGFQGKRGRGKRKRYAGGGPKAKRQKAAEHDHKVSNRGKTRTKVNLSKYKHNEAKNHTSSSTSKPNSGTLAGRKPGFLNLAKPTRSFLGGSMVYTA
ncbi:hypothetical protein LSH36_19g11032 [Paralvinella palmiformis]|uniref:HRDC domain-containing protein n=1 Tax=Paralvinella palmiformis TaxID=53620 RepID=A0AAD9KAR3_9ANNE|nr:hypothetical protein LSH36_19g11032 [Paralvinella palmiformis]